MTCGTTLPSPSGMSPATERKPQRQASTSFQSAEAGAVVALGCFGCWLFGVVVPMHGCEAVWFEPGFGVGRGGGWRRWPLMLLAGCVYVCVLSLGLDFYLSWGSRWRVWLGLVGWLLVVGSIYIYIYLHHICLLYTCAPCCWDWSSRAAIASWSRVASAVRAKGAPSMRQASVRVSPCDLND